MQKSLRFVSLLVVFAALTGCATCKSKLNDTGGKLTITGFDWALPKSTTNTVHIGKFEYEPQEVKSISETLMALDAYQYAQCKLMDQASKIKPTPTAEITKLIAAQSLSNDKILAIATILANGPSKEKVMDVVGKAGQQTIVPTSTSEATSPQPADPKASYSPPAEWYVRTEKRIDEMVGLLTNGKSPGNNGTQNNGNAVNSPDSKTLTISGFAIGKSTLTDSMKNEIASFFRTISEAAQRRQVLTIALVGYADTSGKYANNIALGLSRAKSVANYLERIDLLSPTRMRFISSAGVSNDFSSGRQVEIHVVPNMIL